MNPTPCKGLLLLLACLLFIRPAFGQAGRVVINEYMPWTSNGCGTTSEFIELLNFGPGPVDISCYILTTGKYSITFPLNTVLQPGEFYVLSGMDIIPTNCGNTDSSATGVQADLNWNTCNCTNLPIPTTGDGLMTDGGTSNTPLVLFDPRLNVVDAVVRNLPVEASVPLTTSGITGCSPKTFDLNSFAISYELLGMAAGRGNSFARTVDGDCNWVKDPQQSANASNNRGSDGSSLTYSFSLVNPTACSGGGRVSIHVQYTDYSTIFPMGYTLAYDSNQNGVFDDADTYTTAVDSTAPNIDVANLPVGRYRITVSSVKGCHLRSFDFTIVDCYYVLPVRIEYFKLVGTSGSQLLQWKLHGVEDAQSITIESAAKEKPFVPVKEITEQAGASGTKIYTHSIGTAGAKQFRLKIKTRSGLLFYSPIVWGSNASTGTRVWPVPATDQLNIKLPFAPGQSLVYSVVNSSGIQLLQGTQYVPAGQETTSISVQKIPPGVYQLQLQMPVQTNQPICIQFVKH